MTTATAARFGVAFAAGLAAAAVGCDRTEPSLDVWLASSLAEVLPDSVADENIRWAADGSQRIVFQIVNGAPIDMAVLVEPFDAQALRTAGYHVVSAPLACNRVVIAKRTAYDGTDAVADPAALWAVSAANVPLGHHATRLLDAMTDARGSRWREQVDNQIVARSRSARATVTQLALGEADIGIVYASDVATSDGALEEVDVGVHHPIARYRVAIDAESTVAAITAEGLFSPAHRAALIAAGLQPCGVP